MWTDIATTALLLVALGLIATWSYGITSIPRSVETAKRARKLVEKRTCLQSVSVIIAARNEAKNLEGLLPRLLETGFKEVIVIDDASSDDTPRVLKELSRRYPQLVTIRVEGPPSGWAPKPYALSLGATRARGEVLLFLDADVEPFDTRELYCLATRTQRGEIIGLVPRFLCKTRRCAAIEAAVTATAYGFYGLHRVMNKGDKVAWMYGCCWLIRRETYHLLGGHSLVKSSYVEDRDFAGAAKHIGLDILLIDARDVVGTWTYDTVNEYAWLIARLFLDPLKRRNTLGRLAAIMAVMTTIYGPILLALASLIVTSPLVPVFIAPLVLQVMGYALGSVIEGYSMFYALPGLFYGQLVYPLGLLRVLLGDVYWKQRIVSTSGSV